MKGKQFAQGHVARKQSRFKFIWVLKSRVRLLGISPACCLPGPLPLTPEKMLPDMGAASIVLMAEPNQK